MVTIESAVNKVIAYANDNSHGYKLGLGHGSNPSYASGCDCSGLVRLYAAYLKDVKPSEIPDFSTATQKAVLAENGFTVRTFSKNSLVRGDVLLSTSKGHTVIWLGNNLIVGAEGDWDGCTGDGSGNEICVKSYYAYDYNYVLRPKKEEDDMTDAQVKQLISAATEILRKDDAASDGRKNSIYKRIAWIDKRVRCLDDFESRMDDMENMLKRIVSKMDA